MNLPALPISLLLIPYALFVGLQLIFLSFNVHHLRRFGVKGMRAHAIALGISVCTLLIVGSSAIYLSRFDWGQTIDLNNIMTSLTNTSLPTL